MARAEHQTQQAEISQYYFGYLGEAVVIFESAIRRLKHCEDSQCDLADATDMAHRIKGNAAMYGYPDLGLACADVEAVLRAKPNRDDHANVQLLLIKLVDRIHAICRHPGKSELAELRNTLAANEETPLPVSQSTETVIGRKRIILAYQDIWVCELMASLLEPEFDVRMYNSGQDVERALASGPVEFVILEDTLGDTSALDIVTTMKGRQGLKDLPVFVAFNENSPDRIAKAISLGVNGFADDKLEILEIVNFVKNFLNKPAKSVLVVDDDPMVRSLLKDVLLSDGLRVDIACDGLEALDYLSENTPDLVLLDRFMPRLEGGTVLYEIQNKINLKSIPVLILTAMVNRGEAKSWFERGAADFIPKPFDPDEVLMRVKHHLENRQ